MVIAHGAPARVGPPRRCPRRGREVEEHLAAVGKREQALEVAQRVCTQRVNSAVQDLVNVQDIGNVRSCSWTRQS